MNAPRTTGGAAPQHFDDVPTTGAVTVWTLRKGFARQVGDFDDTSAARKHLRTLAAVGCVERGGRILGESPGLSKHQRGILKSAIDAARGLGAVAAASAPVAVADEPAEDAAPDAVPDEPSAVSSRPSQSAKGSSAPRRARQDPNLCPGCDLAPPTHLTVCPYAPQELPGMSPAAPAARPEVRVKPEESFGGRVLESERHDAFAESQRELADEPAGPPTLEPPTVDLPTATESPMPKPTKPARKPTVKRTPSGRGKADATCDAKGCTHAAGAVYANTREVARPFCPDHRTIIRNSGRHTEGGEDAVAEMLRVGTMPQPMSRVEAGRKSAESRRATKGTAKPPARDPMDVLMRELRTLLAGTIDESKVRAIVSEQLSDERVRSIVTAVMIDVVQRLAAGATS